MHLTSRVFTFFISIILLGIISAGVMGVYIALPGDIGGSVVVIICMAIFFSVVTYNYPSIKISGDFLERKILFVTLQKRDLSAVKDLVIRYSYFEILFQDGTTWPIYDTWYSGGFLVLNRKNRKKRLESILSLAKVEDSLSPND